MARISRDLENVPLRAIRKASNAEAKLPAPHQASASGRGRRARHGGGYLLRNQMRLYEIYDGENWCLEETDAKDVGLIKSDDSRSRFGDCVQMFAWGFIITAMRV